MEVRNNSTPIVTITTTLTFETSSRLAKVDTITIFYLLADKIDCYLHVQRL